MFLFLETNEMKDIWKFYAKNKYYTYNFIKINIRCFARATIKYRRYIEKRRLESLLHACMQVDDIYNNYKYVYSFKKKIKNIKTRHDMHAHTFNAMYKN